ncbi:murein biosynthesis integral membrane protein MurJ [Macrococcus animalis]|uniref:murein biosynthesis integral membrane protein MurJ n=1 Tax=Macrococcus animalis TaxID=3395467 RepID=UPI0039BE76A1
MNANKTTKAIVIMIILGMISKSLGLIRETFIASKYGSGIETDIFFIAITAVGLFTSMFTLTLNTTLIPILSEVENKEGKEAKVKITNNILNVICVLAIFVSIIGWFISPYLIEVMANGFNQEQKMLTTTLMRIGIPGLIFSGIVGVYRGFLQSEGKFSESSTSQFAFNFVYIFYLIFFASIYGIKGLMVASVLAIASQIILQLVGLKSTYYKYKFSLDFFDPYFVRMLGLMLPILISVSVNDVNKIVDRALASGLNEGSISALNYSARLNSLVLAIFITAISTVLFPTLSKLASSEKFSDLKNTLTSGISAIIIIILPITIGTIVLSQPIVSVVFERGAFDYKDTVVTSQALTVYTIGLLGMSIRTLIENVFYSLHDTKTPMMNGIFTVIFNIIFCLLLVGPLEHIGLALATSIVSTLMSIILFVQLEKKIGKIPSVNLAICFIKCLLGSAVMTIFIYYIYYGYLEAFIRNDMTKVLILAIIIILSAIIYALMLFVLKVKEVGSLLKMIKKG